MNFNEYVYRNAVEDRMEQMKKLTYGKKSFDKGNKTNHKRSVKNKRKS